MSTTQTGSPEASTTYVLTSSAKRTFAVTPHPNGGCELNVEDVSGNKIAGGLLRPQDRDALIAALTSTKPATAAS